jgi:hypothetical protein
MESNFKYEHQLRLNELLVNYVLDNKTIKSKIGQELNVIELLHTLTIQALKDIRFNIDKAIEHSKSKLDEWSNLTNLTEELEDLAMSRELVNLIIGYRINKAQNEETLKLKNEIISKINDLNESKKSTDDKISELEKKLEEL